MLRELMVLLRRKQTVGLGAVFCRNDCLLRSQICVLSMKTLLISSHIYYKIIGCENSMRVLILCSHWLQTLGLNRSLFQNTAQLQHMIS